MIVDTGTGCRSRKQKIGENDIGNEFRHRDHHPRRECLYSNSQVFLDWAVGVVANVDGIPLSSDACMREAFDALQRIGRKTANVVLNTAFRQLTMAVDTHIFRVSNRTGIARGKNVVEVETQLMKFVPKPYLLDSHHWLILHGRYVCQARKPRSERSAVRPGK